MLCRLTGTKATRLIVWETLAANDWTHDQSLVSHQEQSSTSQVYSTSFERRLYEHKEHNTFSVFVIPFEDEVLTSVSR